LSCMGEMAAALAHELNQPLCAIMTYTQACLRMLPDDGNTAAEVRHAMERVSANAERAGEIIRHLRGFVGKSEPQQQCADINAVVNEVLGFCEADARATRVQLHTVLGKVPEVTIDPVQIQQVILNLTRNAIEAMDIPACTTRELAIETLRSDDRHIEVRVTDTGPGLPVEIAAKAFNAFITTKASGMGMGLSISRAIIEAHGGRIWVNERTGGGAVFHFTLPITND
jgi:two-component system, LuxR family, sensor kinase FixL